MRKPWFLLLVLLALVGAACGGDDGGSEGADPSPTTEAPADDEAPDDADEADEEEVEAHATDVATPAFLRTAAERTAEEGSGRMEMVIELTGAPGLDGTIELTGTGSYDTEAGQAEIVMDMSGLIDSFGAEAAEQQAQLEQVFGDGTFRIVTDGTTIYMNMPFLASLFGSDAEWIKMDASSAGGSGLPGIGSIGTGSPATMLESLRGVTDDIEEVGTEDVRGEPTTHLRGTLDLAQAIEAAPEEQREEIEAALSQLGGDGEVPFDVFVDDEGLVRRFGMDLSSLTGAQAEGATGAMTIDFFDFGADVEIQIPPADDVFDATEQLGGLAGGDTGA